MIDTFDETHGVATYGPSRPYRLEFKSGRSVPNHQISYSGPPLDQMDELGTYTSTRLGFKIGPQIGEGGTRKVFAFSKSDSQAFLESHPEFHYHVIFLADPDSYVAKIFDPKFSTKAKFGKTEGKNCARDP